MPRKCAWQVMHRTRCRRVTSGTLLADASSRHACEALHIKSRSAFSASAHCTASWSAGSTL
jgi:hypothetical protein